jgi:fructoselysine 3-epimerase
VHIHVSDSNRVIPGEGRVDWIGLMQALNECAYSGYVTMEIGLDSRTADPDQIGENRVKILKGGGITAELRPSR